MGIIKKLWVNYLRMATIIILSVVIGASGLYDIQQYLTIRHEADWAYGEAMKLKQLRESRDIAPEVEEQSETSKEDVDSETEDTISSREEEAKKVSSPSPTDELLRKVRILESSGGKNDSCLTKGMVNGYGFMQSTFHWRCYQSHEEVKTLVAEWYQDKFAKGYTLEESLCLYNLGKKTSDCEYAKKFIALK